MNNLTLLSRVTSYLDECHNLIGSSKKFGIDRRYQVRCCKAIYFRNTVVKMVNCKYCYIQTKEQWYKEGKLHRDTINPATGLTLPTIIYTGDTQVWYKNNKIHRDDDLPAVIYRNGTQIWYKNGKRHRNTIDPATGSTLPAYIYASGAQEWYKEGNYHRDEIDPATGLPLPAIIYPDGYQSWYKDGVQFYPED